MNDAPTSDRHAQNQAFLQAFERQRLAKPCLRSIDLRGKVSGECHAYEIGGKVHYLDDRAYLIIKQLLERFQGRYTQGVYEGLMRVLQQLKASTAQQTSVPEPVSASPQTVSFDQQIQRREPRIRLTTPVTLDADEIRYHASTLDITTSALRISLKPAYSLQVGMWVYVGLPELQAQAEAGLLSDIPYRIIRIDSAPDAMRMVLIRQREDDENLSQWWDDWCQRHHRPDALDCDNELANLQRDALLRLYARGVASPMGWLSADGQLQRLHLGSAAQVALRGLQDAQRNLRLDYLPIHARTAPAQQLIGLITTADDTPWQITAPVDASAAEAAEYWAWAAADPARRLWLITRLAQNFSDTDYQAELEQMAAIDAAYASDVQQRLQSISSVLMLHDLTPVAQGLGQSAAPPQLPVHPAQSVSQWPWPHELRHCIQRARERFVIHTPIIVKIGEALYSATTEEVSASGLSVRLPISQQLSIASSVEVQFERWQKLAKSLNLSQVPYVLRRQTQWQGESLLGLQRQELGSNPALAEFFESQIQANQSALGRLQDDVLLSQESRIFTAQLSKHWQQVVLYLGLNSETQRQLQWIGRSQQGQRPELESLWPQLAELTAQLSWQIKPQTSQESESHSMGLYAYQQADGQWHMRVDAQFSDAGAKQRFVHLALRAPVQAFFHCTVVPFKTQRLEEERDLQQQLLSLRSNAGHKVKAVRERLSGLFAMVQLTDITDTLQVAFRAQR